MNGWECGAGREKFGQLGWGESKEQNEMEMCVLRQGNEMMKAMSQEIQSENNMQNVLVGRE